MTVHAAVHKASGDFGVPDRRRAEVRTGAWPVPADTPSWAEVSLLHLQRLAGNGAVVQLLRDARSRALPLQREDDEQDDETSQEGAGSSGGEAATPSTDDGATGASAEAPDPMFGGDADGAGAETAAGAESGDDGPTVTGGEGGEAAAGGELAEGESAGGESADGEGGASASGEGAGGESAEGEGGESASGEGSTDDQPASEGGDSGPDGESGPDDGAQSQEDQDRKTAEGDSVTGSDEYVDMAGGAPPSAGALGGGFHDGGRTATVPFGDAPSCSLLEEAAHPHAFVGGGASGSVKWAGGGPAHGPKGNQGSGSLQAEIKPEYDTRGNGPFSSSDAWVRPGTGVANVTRDYSTSGAGDQGNGWWISSAAATYLDGHEQRHVAAARDVYGSTIGNMDDRVSGSADYGRGKLYWASDAITYVSNYIAWKRTLQDFKDQDASWNAPQGEVDQRDLGSGGYPRNQKGPRTIGGTQFDNYLIMPSEPDPS